MKYKTITDIDEQVAEKRKIGGVNLRQKLQDLRLHENDPVAIKRYKEKQINYYENEIHSLKIQIRRREENMGIARQLFEKNKHREELKLYKTQMAIETLEGYIAIYKEKPKKEKKKKKAFIPPDPVVEAIPELKITPEDLYAEIIAVNTTVEMGGLEEPIPLTPEEKAALIAEKEAQLKALEEEDEEEFPCPHCNRVYSSVPILKRHITMRHKED